MRSPGGLLLLSCVLFAGCAVAAPYQIDAAAPRTLTLSRSTASGGSTEYYADGQAVVREEYGKPASDGSFPLRKRKQARLTAAQWTRFWQSVDRFAIERWRTSYSADGMGVAANNDGEAWRVEMHKDGHVFRCEGANVYPDLKHPGQRASDRAALTQLIEVFEQGISAAGTGR